MESIPFKSRPFLAEMGVTIFTVMSQLAAKHGAVNLSQGFPDFQAEPALFDAVDRAMRSGLNQYAPMAGVPALREAIAEKTARIYGVDFDVDREITVTAGATQAIFTAVAAFAGPGDEVLVFEPVYDAYVPAIEAVGATAVYAQLKHPEYRPDWEQVRSLITSRTKMVIINSPHNPTGALLGREDLDCLASLLANTSIVVLSDEVYEHIVFDGMPHQSVCAHPDLAQRSLVVSSFGKTFHITGWKIAYVMGAASLMADFRKVHQFNVFSVHAPSQYALAEYLQVSERYLTLPGFYQEKRDFFRRLMAETPFCLLPCASTYFQLASYEAIADCPDTEFAEWLTREIGVAVIPVSVFSPHMPDAKVIRFCFAKQEATLLAAFERLKKLNLGS